MPEVFLKCVWVWVILWVVFVLFCWILLLFFWFGLVCCFGGGGGSFFVVCFVLLFGVFFPAYVSYYFVFTCLLEKFLRPDKNSILNLNLRWMRLTDATKRKCPFIWCQCLSSLSLWELGWHLQKIWPRGNVEEIYKTEWHQFHVKLLVLCKYQGSAWDIL